MLVELAGKKWDVDIYAEYDYDTGRGSKPVTQQTDRAVFQLLKDRQEKRGPNGRVYREKAPFTQVIPNLEQAHMRRIYKKKRTGESVRKK